MYKRTKHDNMIEQNNIVVITRYSTEQWHENEKRSHQFQKSAFKISKNNVVEVMSIVSSGREFHSVVGDTK